MSEAQYGLMEVLTTLLHTVDQVVEVREHEKQKNVVFVKMSDDSEFTVQVDQIFFPQRK
jgi:hypothetical protein